MVDAGFNTKAPSKGEYELRPGCNGLHINPLELVCIIINLVLALAWATTVATITGCDVFNIWADNTSTLSWMKNTVRDTNPISPCLVRFFMAILVTSGIPCILQGEHTPVEEYVGADRMLHPTLVPSWESVYCDSAKPLLVFIFRSQLFQTPGVNMIHSTTRSYDSLDKESAAGDHSSHGDVDLAAENQNARFLESSEPTTKGGPEGVACGHTGLPPDEAIQKPQ
jgi:hypothetical protein